MTTPVDPPQVTNTKPPLSTRYVDLSLRYVDLSLLGIATPPGWTNDPSEFDLDDRFVTDVGVYGVLEHYGFHHIRVVIQCNEVYIVQAERNGRRNYFQWNYLPEQVRMFLDDMELEEVVAMAGSNMALARFVYVIYPEE